MARISMHRALFVRPSVIAEGSPAKPLFKDLESEIIRAIEAGLK